MRTGVFAEQDHYTHVAARQALLDSSRTLPEPLGGAVATAGGTPAEVAGVVRAALRQHGAAVVQLEELLSDDDFRAVGAHLGTAMPETDPAVQPFVTDGVVLNLVTRHSHTADTSLQPFAENSLSLHTEGSGRPAGQQPRHIVLMCQDPGANPASAQTVLVPMSGVRQQLSPEHEAVLSRTRYAHLPAGETILREHEGRAVFSFRDFLNDKLEWVNEGDDSAEAVEQALQALLSGMYTAGAAGVHWRRGLLVVVDNTYFFHGRTAGVSSPAHPRHLKRLRLT
ncbi:Taurine catabolism dioxygenase TauD, TfdA family [Lentzea fradiae]|uniref:Taurine catabolism dioxygenase TauD, TfdA family n=1 Tax=Lentzea fradiae TaxID=200378 RepID=A0A1G7VIH6_9PSEU|nr:TauD/TfdA family dioxygenase [Lentzea fradiae]SDG59533.1 Taurine catabolism dioxygenase TauD, TfdA family [Lentzea fradiae]